MSNRNDRSDAVMRERLKLAEKATQGPWYHTLAAIVGTKKSPEDNDATCICSTEWGCSGDPQANAAHIAASSPDVVRADIEEILRLRAENELLALENQRLTVDGAKDESYLLTCLDIIRKSVGMPVGSDWQQVAERVDRLGKESDWLVKMLSLYTEDCPLKFSWVYAEKLPIPKIDDCEGTWSVDDCFHCSGRNPGQCWREAARKAVEDENG